MKKYITVFILIVVCIIFTPLCAQNIIHNYYPSVTKPIPTNSLDNRKFILKDWIQSENSKITDEEALFLACLIVDYSDEHKLDYKWTTAIGNIESTYDRNAKNNHSVGIMQINKPWWVKELKEKEYIKTEKDLYNPVNNIRSGCYILKQKLEQTGNIYKAVTWYNKVDGDLTYLSFVIDKYNRYKEFENGWESKRKSI